MNPYKTPDQQADEENASGDGSGAGLEDHPQYGVVLKMVMWGEDRADIFHRLSVNGVPDGLAKHLHAHAVADRIRTIRRGYSRKLLTGVYLILIAVAPFSLFWLGPIILPRILIYACFASLGIGSWKLIDGLAGYLMAPSRKGSVAEGDW